MRVIWSDNAHSVKMIGQILHKIIATYGKKKNIYTSIAEKSVSRYFK